MLRCKNLTVRVAGGGPEILSHVDAAFRPQAMNAVIGPSGCGKTTLVKAIMRLLPAQGEAFFDGTAIANPDELAGRVGFAPQFTTAHPQLSVEETFRAALDLAVSDGTEKRRRMDAVLGITGLGEHRDKRVGALSGGQLRRLGLGLELTLDPPCMVCDEVTSGLDPNSETQILDLLRRLVEERGKTFVCIIHNLAKLEAFDWVSVVHLGAVIFQGTLPQLLAYFAIPDALHLYDQMNAHPLAYWRERWAAFLLENPNHVQFAPAAASVPSQVDAAPTAPMASPSAASQFLTLLRRRFLLFFRDTGYFALTMAITFGFPVIVVIFAINGLPAVPEVPLDRVTASMEAFKQALSVEAARMHAGSLASGLIMFQVILLTLMGANNGGREIAAERTLYEKERLTGLRPGAYVLSKIVFVALIACFQGAWMAMFVKTICQFPGPWSLQLLTMITVCVSMSIVCLGFSAIMQSSEKASLLSIYLVGFQIPLSGVVLALPDALTWVCRPFINAYWGWAGFMSSMHTERIYDAFSGMNTGMSIAEPWTANAALLAQALAGAVVIVIGCFMRRAL
ncbi:MAG: ABC transporter ATP-binding protein/permease [Puniceicoccales bacterium]|jgi:ABC-type multidrug transport system ATPase subunit|nr:ABC transporter ATP-binding protein/permease [Puniceicoccales bacterium]